MRRIPFFTFLAPIILGACSGGSPATPPRSNDLVLSQNVAYLGTSDACFKAGKQYCLRGPGFGDDIGVSQAGNPAQFAATSSDASVVTGVLVMLGPGGHGSPAIELGTHAAGSATLTITGADGATAPLPVVVTTISTMTVDVGRFPSANTLSFTVLAPAGPACPTFAGGYSFDVSAPTPPATSITLGNFPAMGNGQSATCLFTTVKVVVTDDSNNVLKKQTFKIPVVLGKDNPTSITIS